eukprot:scaffold17313_cov22-Tisochrysis_lutea.AAC.1
MQASAYKSGDVVQTLKKAFLPEDGSTSMTFKSGDELLDYLGTKVRLCLHAITACKQHQHQERKRPQRTLRLSVLSLHYLVRPRLWLCMKSVKKAYAYHVCAVLAVWSLWPLSLTDTRAHTHTRMNALVRTQLEPVWLYAKLGLDVNSRAILCFKHACFEVKHAAHLKSQALDWCCCPSGKTLCVEMAPASSPGSSLRGDALVAGQCEGAWGGGCMEGKRAQGCAPIMYTFFNALTDCGVNLNTTTISLSINADFTRHPSISARTLMSAARWVHSDTNTSLAFLYMRHISKNAHNMHA